MLPQSITQFLLFRDVYYTYRCAFLIRTQRVYFYWNRVKIDKYILQILYAPVSFAYIGPVRGRTRTDPAGPGQLNLALAPGPIGPVRVGPRATVLRPCPWTVYLNRYGFLLIC